MFTENIVLFLYFETHRTHFPDEQTNVFIVLLNKNNASLNDGLGTISIKHGFFKKYLGKNYRKTLFCPLFTSWKMRCQYPKFGYNIPDPSLNYFY